MQKEANISAKLEKVHKGESRVSAVIPLNFSQEMNNNTPH